MHTQIPLKYSQNFIRDPKLVDVLVELADLDHSDTVLDIGTGDGIIARSLAKHVHKVIAIEKDSGLFLKAKENLRELKNVEVILDDIVRFKLPRSSYKVFANIPFSITAEIVKKLFEDENPPKAAHLFMQKEAALKFCGAPLANESLSSLLYKPFYDIKVVYNFKKEDFDPIPSKDVCLLEFKQKEKFNVAPQQYPEYRDFVTYFLTRWKSNIKQDLKGVFSNLQTKILAERLGFSLDAKPTELNYDTWLNLYKEFNKIVPPYKKRIIRGSFLQLNLNQLNMRRTNQNNLEQYRNNGRSTNKRHNMASRRR
jgi:23S rRNA (adenine-N6)-dimethyltransferase